LHARELGSRDLSIRELGGCGGPERAVFAAVHSHPSWQFADPTRLAARDQLGAEALHKLSRRGGHVLGDRTA
jgi:hypothetical protein